MPEHAVAGEKLRVLVVEDDLGVVNSLRQILDPYRSSVIVDVAEDAGAAIRHYEVAVPRVLVVDIMMLYRDGADVLGSDDDEREWDTGTRFVEWVRERERSEGRSPGWVAIITARSEPDALRRAAGAIGPRGRLFRKPFDSILFEVLVCGALGIESLVPKVLETEVIAEESRRSS